MSFATGVKLDRIADFREQRGFDELWLLQPSNFSWLTAGNSVIDTSSADGVAAIGAREDELRLVVPNNEEARILEEELPALDATDVPVRTDVYGWETASLRDAVAEHASGTAAADTPIDGLDEVDVSSLRAPLPEPELERYRTTCEEATEAVERVAADVTPETTEREAAAALAAALRREGFSVPVVLVGGSDRSVEYRHFTPTANSLDSFAHLTVVAERGGHNVAVTRTVTFDPPTWLMDRHRAACRVAATAVAATQEVGRQGGTASDILDAIRDAYAAVGFEDEWRKHHQGGAIGFETREWTATPDADVPVTLPMPFAWNPTVRGAKCEDTVLVTDTQFENWTRTGEWPTTRYDAVGYDEQVVFHDPMPLD